jgi:hypothetical protein
MFYYALLKYVTAWLFQNRVVRLHIGEPRNYHAWTMDWCGRAVCLSSLMLSSEGGCCVRLDEG